MLYLSTSNSAFFAKVANQRFYDIDVRQMIQGRLVDVAETDLMKQVKDNDNLDVDSKNKDDEIIDDNEKSDDAQQIHVEVKNEITSDDYEAIAVVTARPQIARPPKPTLAPEILELHRRLNLTSHPDYPGRWGAPVKLPENLDPDIERMLNKSKEKYQINEFISNLIPLDREIPDIRNEYCKNMKYSDNLPMASVIMVFHNEALSMILRYFEDFVSFGQLNYFSQLIFIVIA